MPSPLAGDLVIGAHLRWHRRSAHRFYDGKVNPDFDGNDDPDYNPLTIASRLGKGTDNKGNAVCLTRVRAGYVTADSTIRIDVEVRFTLVSDELLTDPDSDFIERHALPYVFGFARGAFTDACRSVGLKGLMIPMVNLSDSILTGDPNEDM